MPFPALGLLLATLAGLAGLAAAAVALGDLRSLYEACAGRVHAMAYQLLRDRAEAEDVVQETFLEAWRHAERYDPARGPREAWVVLIGRSRALDRLRARGSAARAAARSAGEPAAPAAPPLELVEARQRRGRLEAALAGLPSPPRQAIELAFYAGLPQSEIAAQLGEPLGTVKTRVRLAMERLASALEEDAA